MYACIFIGDKLCGGIYKPGYLQKSHPAVAFVSDIKHQTRVPSRSLSLAKMRASDKRDLDMFNVRERGMEECLFLSKRHLSQERYDLPAVLFFLLIAVLFRIAHRERETKYRAMKTF
jgi:hypothetical protein